MAGSRSDRARDAGFTLIEMIVVIVVLGLALTLILSHGRTHSPRLSLSAARTEMIGALRAARGHAIGADHPVILHLSPDGSLSGDGAPHTLHDATVIDCDGHEAPARIAIEFLPDGSARIGDAARDGEICLGAGDLRTRIAIDWFTGRVHAT